MHIILFIEEKSTETWFMLIWSKSMRKMSASRLINFYVKQCSSLIEIISSIATEEKQSHLNDFEIQPK